jgi:hypothetical protein
MNIPNLPPVSKTIDENGYRTPVEQVFMQQLITELQKGAGTEGLVAPTQLNEAAPNNFVTQIQNHQNGQNEFTCQLGTILYVIPNPADYTQDKVMIAVRNDNTYPATAPIFKTVTLT